MLGVAVGVGQNTWLELLLYQQISTKNKLRLQRK